MAQCISCRYFVMHGSPRGHGECWQSRIGKGESGRGAPVITGLVALDIRVCKVWKLLEMGQIGNRSKRKWVWDSHNVVSLKG